MSILVTGSAKLDVYQARGESLMGRYFPYRVHPLSVAECVRNNLEGRTIASPLYISSSDFDALWNYGGYPDPFLKRNRRFHTKWNETRVKQFFEEDIRELTNIQEVA